MYAQTPGSFLQNDLDIPLKIKGPNAQLQMAGGCIEKGRVIWV